jgi:hypothetical protein
MSAILEKINGNFHKLIDKNNPKQVLYYLNDLEILGVGGYGKVVKGINVQRNLPLAVKSI